MNNLICDVINIVLEAAISTKSAYDKKIVTEKIYLEKEKKWKSEKFFYTNFHQKTVYEFAACYKMT